mgnify:CR=1 FL=1
MLKVCGISSFLRKAENLDEVICYGAGHQLKDFAELFKDTIVLDKCKYVVDRNKEKQGSEIYFGNVRFSVISPEHMQLFRVRLLLPVSGMKRSSNILKVTKN